VQHGGRRDLLNDRLVARLAELAETAATDVAGPSELVSALHGDLSLPQMRYHRDPVTGAETITILDWQTAVDSPGTDRVPLRGSGYSQPRSSATRRASIRLRVPVLVVAPDR
jgi:hypothetical protein